MALWQNSSVMQRHRAHRVHRQEIAFCPQGHPRQGQGGSGLVCSSPSHLGRWPHMHPVTRGGAYGGLIVMQISQPLCFVLFTIKYLLGKLRAASLSPVPRQISLSRGQPEAGARPQRGASRGGSQYPTQRGLVSTKH